MEEIFHKHFLASIFDEFMNEEWALDQTVNMQWIQQCTHLILIDKELWEFN